MSRCCMEHMCSPPRPSQVRDLFNPKLGELKIRNDPKRGFFVENLTRNAVASVSSINKVW
jgi:hypothetical protein